MGHSRKGLKNSSVIVLALAALSLLNILFELFFGEFNDAAIPAGSPDNILLIAQIFILVVSILLLLPQFYVGFRGLKIAKNPDSSSGHIVWGYILIVFTAAGLISPFLALIQGEDAFANVATLLSIAVDVVVLIEYVKYAKAVRDGY